MLKIYNFFYNLFALPMLFFLGFFIKKLGAGAKEKFGNYSFKSDKKTLWIHCVSVGEVMLATTLLKKLDPSESVILTTSTPQGQKMAQEKFSDRCAKITYFPYDTKFAIKNAIRAINPKMVLIMETEIWPNFANELKKQNIPLLIVNGRISEATYKSYRYLKFFFKNVFKNYSYVLTQTPQDAERFIKIGADEKKVQNMGNIKFDLEKQDEKIKENYTQQFRTNGRKILIFGSTHGDENRLFVNSYKKLSKKIEDLKLIIAPRHLEKVEQIEKFLTSENIKYKKRSEGANFDECDVIILNTTGELGKVYSICDICVLGGSFNNTGGHNPLEATIWGKPVISGPNVKNFRYIFKSLIEAKCAVIVNDEKELTQQVLNALIKNECLAEFSQNCDLVLAKNRGATEFLINFLNNFNNKE